MKTPDLLVGGRVVVEAAELWHVPPVLDDDGRIVDLVSGQEVDWPPIAN